MTRPTALLLATALLLVACSGPPGPQPGDDAVSGTDGNDVGFSIVDDPEPAAEEDPLVDALEDFPESIVELTATGLVEGEFRPFPSCSVREGEDGAYLQAAFDTSSDTGPGVPALGVVFRIRPYDHTGPIELTGDDVEVDYHPEGDFTSEPMDARVSASVTRGDDPTFPIAQIEFDGRYEGASGSGTFRGRLTCKHEGR